MLTFRVGVELGGVMTGASRDDVHETVLAALNALAQSLPQFVDMEGAVRVSLLPTTADEKEAT